MNGNLFTFLTFAVLLVIGFSLGTIAEKRHFASISKREEELRHIIIVASKYPPQPDRFCRTALVCGSVVIGMDYFKMALASILNFLGGRISAYETLLDRARREAILRMKEDAERRNGRYIFNMKFSTANIMGQKAGNPGCVEVIAYGTVIVQNDER